MKYSLKPFLVILLATGLLASGPAIGDEDEKAEEENLGNPHIDTNLTEEAKEGDEGNLENPHIDTNLTEEKEDTNDDEGG